MTNAGTSRGGDLTDEVCVVTGGASGIGRALAHRFAAAGMRVALADIEADPLATAVAGLGGDGDRVLGVRCDVSSATEVEQLRDVVLARFGDVHLVCLNAGVAPTGPLLDTPPAVWDWVLGVNLLGVVHGIAAFGPRLVERGRGHIVCTASVAGVTDTPTVGAYGTSKHAVVGLATALRHELAGSGVGVSVVCPGFIETRIFESERNRPAGMDDPSVDNPTSKAYRELLATRGVPPARVAEFVHRAVLDDQLFVFPTTDFDLSIEGRIAAIRQGLEWRDAVAVELGQENT